MNRTIKTMALMALGSLFIMGCKKEETEGRIMVRLTDAPAAYQQVNVEILKVRVHMSNGSWTDLPTNSGVYNLLSLQNGIDTTIVNTTQLPAGDITQMRLVLGSNNTLMADSVTYPLTVPSGSESGIKLVGGLSIPGNSTLNVLIDFDANQSIVQGGNGDYQLKPVIKVVQ
jgi:hypothetical protein